MIFLNTKGGELMSQQEKCCVSLHNQKYAFHRIWYIPDKMFIQEFFIDQNGKVYAVDLEKKARLLPVEDYEIKACSYVYDADAECIYQDNVLLVSYCDLFEQISNFRAVANYKDGLWYLDFYKQSKEIPFI